MEESIQTEAKSKSSLPIVGLVIFVIALGIGGFFLLKSNKSAKPAKQEGAVREEKTETKSGAAMEEKKGETLSATSATSAASASGSATEKNVKSFTVEGSNFKFSPNVITAKKGDAVKIVFTNSGGMHDFLIDEFSVKTKRINAGETDTAEFVASKSGTFEYYCSVGTHRKMGMVGKLVVQ